VSRGRFYLRAEADEWDFIRGLSQPLPFDAAVLSDRYLGEYPEGHPRHGEARDQLAQALDEQGIPWSVDPDTARLEQRSSAKRQTRRAANRPLASALPLPLSAELLRADDAIDALVEAAALHQLTSPAFAAPYLEAWGVDDPRFAANLRLLARSRELAGDRIVVGYLQVLRRSLFDGTAADMAHGLAARGATTIFIRVRRFTPEAASEADVLGYAGMIGAGVRAGARIVPDCVGQLGPVLVAAGADGFATNALRFRKVADDLHPSGGGGGSALTWLSPVGSAGGALAATGCGVANCPAPRGEGDNLAIRIHNLHEFLRTARLAAAERFTFAARLAADPSPIVRGWARALQELERRAA
jgi:hypothetical protein